METILTCGLSCVLKIPREGVIIEWPLNGHFNDARDVILMSRTDVRELEDDDDNADRTLFSQK